MKLLSYCTLLIVMLVVNGCGITLGNQFDDLSNVYTYDIAHIICRYIGVYHEHPKSGDSLFLFLKEDCIREQEDTCLIKNYKDVFLNNKNLYLKNRTTIYDSRMPGRCHVVGVPESWQIKSMGLYATYCRSVYRKNESQYFYYDSDQDTLFRGFLSEKFQTLNAESLRFQTKYINGDTYFIPYRVRVSYSESKGVSVIIHDNIPVLYSKTRINESVPQEYEQVSLPKGYIQGPYQNLVASILKEFAEKECIDYMDLYLPLFVCK